MDERAIKRRIRRLIEKVTYNHLEVSDEALRLLAYPDWVELMAGIYKEEALEEGFSDEASEEIAQGWRDMDEPDQLKGPFPPFLNFDDIIKGIIEGRALAIKLLFSKNVVGLC